MESLIAAGATEDDHSTIAVAESPTNGGVMYIVVRSYSGEGASEISISLGSGRRT